MKVEVVRAWPRGFEQRVLELADGATVDDAVRASAIGLDGVAGIAVHGERALPGRVLRDGDRIELLNGLIADPKEARRTRARRGTRPAEGTRA